MKRMLLLVPSTLLLLAGCSGGHGGSSSSAGAMQLGAGPAAATNSSGSNLASGKADAGSVAAAALQQRDIVRTATLAVTVANVDSSADAAVAATVAAGGRADTDDRSSADNGRSAHLVLRLPPNRLTAMLNRIAGYGHETSRTDHGEDMTAAHADVQARVTELQISVARLQNFLQHSGSINELVSLENQLTQRQQELQSTVAQQRALADQINLATLTVDLSGTLPPAAKAHSGPPGFATALGRGLRGLLITVRVLAAGLGYLAPYLLILTPVAGAGWWLLRRRRPGPGAEHRPEDAAAATP